MRGDGVTAATREHVESVYLRSLEQLAANFAVRPFLLGERPTLADFGFFASMFRHFGLDPDAGRDHARARSLGVDVARAGLGRARLANARGTRRGSPGGVEPDPARDRRRVPAVPLRERGGVEGAREALRRGDPGCRATARCRSRAIAYGVWSGCARTSTALPDAARDGAARLLEAHGCWGPLFRVEAPDSGHDPSGAAPFAPGLAVFPV